MLSPMFSVRDSCNLVISSVRDSSLNFSIQETPFSLYLTIRKSFIKSKEAYPYQNVSNQNNVHEVKIKTEEENLEKKVKQLEKINLTLQNDFEDAISDCESAYKRISDLESSLKEKIASENEEQEKKVEELKQEKSNLDDNLEATTKKLKTLQNVLKNKEREVDNLKKENAIVTAKLVEVETDFANFTLKVKTENRKKKKVDMKASYECDKCDVKTEALQKLTAHKRITHMMTKTAQTEMNDVEDKIVQVSRTEFECDKSEQTSDEQTLDAKIITEETFVKYPCCYCGTMIANKYHLGEHIERCRGTFNMFIEPGLPMLPFTYILCIYWIILLNLGVLLIFTFLKPYILIFIF